MRIGFAASFTVLLSAGTVALHVLGSTVARSVLWGVHAPAFLPDGTIWIATGVFTLLALLFLVPGSPLRRRCDAWDSIPPATAHAPWWHVASAAAAAGALFWLARARHTLLGDGNVILLALPRAEGIHPREPLTAWVNLGLYKLVHGLADDTANTMATARTAVALGSVLGGVVWVVLIWALAGEILARVPPTTAMNRTPARSLSARTLLAGALLAQGYMELACGYIENYTYLLVLLTAFTWALLRALAGRMTLVIPGLLAIVATAFHMFAAVTLPAVGALAAIQLWKPDTRRRALREVLILTIVLGTLAAALFVIGHGYDIAGVFLATARAEILGNNQSRYLLSRPHLRDFFNEQLLIGPLGLCVFLPAAIVAVHRRVARSTEGIVLLVLGATVTGASFVAKDSNLGYARNWDLLAPGGVVTTALGFALLAPACAGLYRHRRLALLVSLSLYHTLPWVALNASETRSLERFKTLPLGFGRTEAVVGNWYLWHGDRATARVWLERSLRAYPDNVNACSLLGNLYMLDGEPERALELFEHAVRQRPATAAYRQKLIQVLLRLRRPEDAMPHFEWLAAHGELRPEDRTRYALVLRTFGRDADARQELTAAVHAHEASLRGSPRDTRALLGVAEALAELGDTTQARQRYQQAVAAAPDSLPPLYALGRFLARQGRYEEARPYLERVLVLDPSHRDSAAIREWLRRADAGATP